MNNDQITYITPIMSLTAAIVGAIIGAYVKYLLDKKSKDEKDKKIESLESDKQTLETEKKSLHSELKMNVDLVNGIKDALKKQILIDCHHQYVLLCGPRSVGKTSLVQRLHTPWELKKTIPNDPIPREANVPVYKSDVAGFSPHPSFASIQIKTKIDISLKIFDFAGDVSLQNKIINVLVDETTKSDNGVVMVFMFDASELNDISSDTKNYYNGDLFKRLRGLQSYQIDIVRIIIVFNKLDRLRAMFPDKSVNELLDECVKKFAPLLEPIHYAVYREKVCEVASILESTNSENEDMGASIIRGEAAREIVKKLVGIKQVNSMIKEKPSTMSAIHFQQ